MKKRKSVVFIGLKKAVTVGVAATILFFTFPQAIAIESNIPDLGQHSQSDLSLESEQTIGNTLMQKINSTDLVVYDPVINEYLEQLAAKFTENAGINDYPLHFFALVTPEINAFAFFGGHIAVHTGLFTMVENESELAAVLAHETAHIAQHHLARILASSKQRMPITFAEIIAAVAIGVLGAPDAGIHLATAALAGHTQHLINFTRAHEHEADRIGMKILAKSNFDPHAMARVFQRLKQSTIYYDHPPEYLLTHPVFESRIADAQNRAAHIPYKRVEDSLLFHLARARIEANSDESNAKRVVRLKEKLNKATGTGHTKTALEYAYALALLKTTRHKEGHQILNQLHEDYPSEWAIEVGLAEAEQVAGEIEEASNRLRRLNEQYPHNYGIIIQYGNLLLAQKKGQEAFHLLQPQRKKHINDPEIHRMLARTYSMIHKKTDVHRSQAEWHFARGEEKEAFKQMELALESAAQDKNKDSSWLIPRIKERRAKMKAILERQKEVKL